MIIQTPSSKIGQQPKNALERQGTNEEIVRCLSTEKRKQQVQGLTEIALENWAIFKFLQKY